MGFAVLALATSGDRKESHARTKRIQDADALRQYRQTVGTIEDVYVDQETKKPEWLLVKTGLFGLRETFVPMSVLRPEGDDLRAPYSKDQITGAPNAGDEEGA